MTVFDKYVKEKNTTATTKTTNNENKSKGLSLLGKILVVVVFPTLMGCIGLYFGYLESKREDAKHHEISFERDFVMPFLLALALVILIGFQTRGFTTNKVEPIIQWPATRTKKQKVIHNARLDGAEGDNDAKEKTDKKND